MQHGIDAPYPFSVSSPKIIWIYEAYVQPVVDSHELNIWVFSERWTEIVGGISHGVVLKFNW